jgi:hypothetical protein
MSDHTPSSFIDDGVDFEKRIPEGTNLREIEKWVDDVNRSSSAPISITGPTLSYLDDGVDVLAPRKRPAIGRVDNKYYENRKEEEGKPGKTYHSGVQRAVNGQIKNTLASMKALESLPVNGNNQRISKEKGQEKIGSGEAEEQESGPPPGAVRVWLPQPPPILVIHGQDGHVAVADGDSDPIDSRSLAGLQERLEQAEILGRQYGKRQCERQQKQNQDPKGSHGQPKQRSEKNEEPGLFPNQPTPPASEPHAWMTGGAGVPSAVSSESVWADDHDDAKSMKSNYHAPTVEDAPELPVKEPCEYLNGYDGP